VSDPAAVADGKTVVFRCADGYGGESRPPDLWSLDLATKGAQPRRLTTHPENDNSPEWSRSALHLLRVRTQRLVAGVAPAPPLAAKQSR
jgi:dipeptidyl aminopeptidase/acylaminoacyl peptidase